MSFRLLVGVAVSALAVSHTAGQRPEGCSEPSRTAKAIAELASRDWRRTSQDDVLAIWPRPAKLIERTEADVPNEKGAAESLAWRRYAEIYSYRGRMILDQCLCCDTLVFGAPNRDSAEYRLTAVIVFHTERTKSSAIAAANEMIAAGIGERETVRSPEVVTVQGRSSLRKNVRGTAGGPRPMTIDVTIDSSGNQWIVYLHFAQQETGVPQATPVSSGKH